MSKNKQNTQTVDVTTEVVTETPVTVAAPRTYAELIETFKTKSGVIRGLHAEGMDCKTIHKTLTALEVKNEAGTHPLRYQHVRNVLNTPVKKS